MREFCDHIPVLSKEVLAILNPKNGETVLDCTVGLGGHAIAFLNYIGENGIFIGIDADRDNLRNAELRMKNIELRQKVKLIHSNFRDYFINPNPTPNLSFDIIFADLGLSSPHLDDASRGFSFREEAPLDMRFDRTKGETAAQFVSRISENELADVLFHFGEIQSSRKIARAMKAKRIMTTSDVCARAEEAVGKCAKNIMPQVFQALRIAINDELGSLAILLKEGPKRLKPNGRMGVISFHSLEDRMVKHAFRDLCTAPKDAVTGADIHDPEFTLITKKSICPSDEEIQRNPRSRSARFRVITRYLDSE